jgi:iron-sulfur cluster assembly accessory protein
METQTQTQAPVPVEGFEFSAQTPVALTSNAVDKVKEAMAAQKLDGHCLRIAVVGGGCSGFNYDLDLVREAKPTDLTYELTGVKVAIDQNSVPFLDGTVIDFVETLQGAGFKFNNPKAKSTCGCGSSFSA